jgi:type IV pilus assembly protein PilF
VIRRRPILFAAAGILLLSCAGPSPERRKEASARMQMGVTYLEQRNLPAAMRELTRASELDPQNPEIDMTLGLAFQARGDLGRAEEHFRRAIAKRPDYPEARNNLGNLLSQLGRGDEAIREYRKAASDVLYPTPEFAYYNMGREYHRRKELEKAEAMHRKAIALNPSFLDAYRALAGVQAEAGRWDDAAGTLEQGVGRAPTFAEGWMDLGSAYLKLQRRWEALQAFRNVLANSADPALRERAEGYINVLEGRGR